MNDDLKTTPEVQARIDKMPKVVCDEVARLNLRIAELVRARDAKSEEYAGSGIVLRGVGHGDVCLPEYAAVRFVLKPYAGAPKNDPAPYIEVSRNPNARSVELRAGPVGGLLLRPNAANTALAAVGPLFDKD